jgi:probable F420-dependent oxidoreductase
MSTWAISTSWTVRRLTDVSPPTIGLFAINSHACAAPEAAARVAALAERLGYDSLWAGEHVVVPSPRVTPSPMEPDEPILDPLVALAHVAAHTERIRLGTGVVILPQRNPVVLAKQVASLDVLSGGRLIFGLGVAYLEPEMRAIGVPMEGRGARADEYLAAMRALWEHETPVYAGRHVRFEGVDAHPRPVQRPLPVVVGGHSRAAHRRAARDADGWYGFMLGLRAVAEQRQLMHAAIEETGRERPLHVSVTPARPLDPDVVGAYSELGVDRLIVAPPAGYSLEELVEFVERNAPVPVGGAPAPGA